MRIKLIALLLSAALGLATPLGSAQAQAAAETDKPRRIVSLDLCTDQLLVDLVPRARIAAVTHLAADPAVSASPEKARGLPITRGNAEDVLRHDPDLILAGPFGVSATVNLLRRLKRNVVVVPLAGDLDGIRASVRAVASAVGEIAKGDAIIADFDRRLAGLPAPPADDRPSALVYQVGGAVSAPGHLGELALEAAGLRNMAREYRLSPAGQAPLEVIVARPPDLLVLSQAAEGYPTVAADNLRHPALRRLLERRASIDLPWQLWLCGTPSIAEAAEKLAAMRVRLGAKRR